MSQFDIVYLAGGWGAAFDLGTSTVVGEQISRANAHGAVLGGVCLLFGFGAMNFRLLRWRLNENSIDPSTLHLIKQSLYVAISQEKLVAR